MIKRRKINNNSEIHYYNKFEGGRYFWETQITLLLIKRKILIIPKITTIIAAIV